MTVEDIVRNLGTLGQRVLDYDEGLFNYYYFLKKLFIPPLGIKNYPKHNWEL